MDSKTLSLLAARIFRNRSGRGRIRENGWKIEKVSRFVDDAACFL
jgi:hypothetical protein